MILLVLYKNDESYKLIGDTELYFKQIRDQIAILNKNNELYIIQIRDQIWKLNNEVNSINKNQSELIKK